MGLNSEQRRLFFRYDRDAPLDVEVSAVSPCNGLRVERFSYASTHGHRVPAVLYQAAGRSGPLPVVIVGHGAGSSKDDPLLRPLFEHWARAGLACLAVDAPYHGDRADEATDLRTLLYQPFTGLHFGVQTAVDLMRSIDWVQTRADLDAGRVGYLGFSMGAVLGVQFVAMESRVRAAVFALGGAGLLHYIAAQAAAPSRRDHEMVADALDPLHFAPLIAPRPVLMVNGLQDQIIPPALGHALYSVLREPRRIIWFEGGHGGVPHEHIDAMRVFLCEHLETPAMSPGSDHVALDQH